MIINRENLIALDKEEKMIPITFDLVFKSVFSKNLEILKEFLVDVLHLEYELEELDIRILNNELPKSKISEYQKRVDVNIVLDDNIYVEIEVNRRDFNLHEWEKDKFDALILYNAKKKEEKKELNKQLN